VDCEYKSDGNNAGALWCQDRNEPGDKEKKVRIEYEEDPKWKNHEYQDCPQTVDYAPDAYAYFPVASCDW
jgi:hypothetical protein